ncbi:MAG: hybrid sensor histidine kinase/response regulator, partial [Chitinophagaceae bacterium]|nr:hybrid sensor histidine kinase/response regulator [Rubrivivax sp.]
MKQAPLRLQQVLRNLLANAIKYSASGAVELEVMAADVAAPDRVVIEVRDRGRGIAQADRATLFQPF